ncbi:hypothetical protein GCM10009628_19970 [Paeniglutamicibacter kerguelensis]
MKVSAWCVRVTGTLAVTGGWGVCSAWLMLLFNPKHGPSVRSYAHRVQMGPGSGPQGMAACGNQEAAGLQRLAWKSKVASRQTTPRTRNTNAAML